MKFIRNLTVLCVLGLSSAMPPIVFAQAVKTAWQTEWEKAVELGKKEGEVVVSIPASSELRTALEKNFKQRFGIDVEAVTAPRKLLD